MSFDVSWKGRLIRLVSLEEKSFDIFLERRDRLKYYLKKLKLKLVWSSLKGMFVSMVYFVKGMIA